MISNPESAQMNNTEQKINYFKLIRVFLSRWYWIAGTSLVAIVIAYLYLWYTPQIYSTNASLKFDDKSSDFTSVMNETGVGRRDNKIQSEMFVIQSREVLLNAISRIDYKISYYLHGRVRTSDVYPNIPYPIEILQQDSSGFYKGLFTLKPNNEKTFELSYQDGGTLIKKSYKVGQIVQAPGLSFRIKQIAVPTADNYSFKFNNREDFLSRVTGSLSLLEASKSSNILQLSFRDMNPAFAMDMLNAIITEYVSTDVQRRRTSASQTIDFIDLQLKFLAGKVQSSGKAFENYKRNNQIIDISTSTEISLSKKTSYETQKRALQLEELTLKQLEEQILNNRDKVELNYTFETSVGGELTGLVSRLNALLLERDRKSLQLLPGSEAMKLLDRQIAESKKANINTIRLLKERNQQTKNFLQNQINTADHELRNIPAAERDFAKLQSEYDINQKVFSFLSEKKLESEINRAAIVGAVSIVDKAAGTVVVSPNLGKVYTNAILIGLVAGFGLILLVRLLNPYIYDKETVESLTSTPIIGVIRKFPGFIDQENRQALSLQKPKSVFAESIRSVRTNLSFLASEKDSKVICITSEISGEGKSFVSVNLASTLALIDKKVILIAADLRRSKLHKTFNHNNKIGLSSYLSQQAELDKTINFTNLDNLHFIPSGPTPPNPSELLHSKKMLELISNLKQRYDYILFDTAPVGLVSDSIPIIRNSDINLFVIRSGNSKFSAASIPERLSKEYHLTNVVIVLNAFDNDALQSRYYNSSYSGGYGQYYYSDYSGYASSGYYSDEEKKGSWWQFWKRS